MVGAAHRSHPTPPRTVGTRQLRVGGGMYGWVVHERFMHLGGGRNTYAAASISTMPTAVMLRNTKGPTDSAG